jgi:farnesyl-diphosphate farnesyltransferase
MAHTPDELLTDLLRDVSRSFYLTLRVLPRSVRPQIGLAYLLARTTDTIADTGIVSVERRLASLQSLRERILGLSEARLDFGALACEQASPSERVLLEKIDETLQVLGALASADRERVRWVLDTIISGQELDLRRFGDASAENIVALQTPGQLDDYTYRVAGCVGEFWTGMIRAHVFAAEAVDGAFLLANGVRFGKGLQLVNILRDLPRDLRLGRCYVPADELSATRLKPAELVKPENEAQFRPVYNCLLDTAEEHLHAGWDYTNALPRSSARVRLACAWPILIGMKTVRLLRERNVLDPHHRVKISRGEVRAIILQSLLRHPWPSLWKKLIPPARKPVAASGKPVASGRDFT